MKKINIELRKAKKMNIELKSVKTVRDAVENCINHPHKPSIFLLEESGNFAFAIKFVTGNYGLYSGLSDVISGGDYIRHEFHYSVDAYIVYELKSNTLDVVSISTDWGHDDFEPITGIKYTIINKDSEPSIWISYLSENEAKAAKEKIKEPVIDVEFWIGGKNNKPLHISTNSITKSNKEKKYCNKCNSKVIKSELEEYSYQCVECDEDLYEFETHSHLENDKIH